MKQIIIPIAFFAMITLITAGRPLIRAWARRIEQGGRADPALDDEARARLERMEAAIEGMALEVERIAEGQRFTTKLLAERGAMAAAAPVAAAPATRAAALPHEESFR
jgi:hypothetical protein